MYDPASGSFGIQSQGGAFSNMNSLYMFNAGQGGGFRPQSSTMMSAKYQYLQGANIDTTMMGFRNPALSTYDFGFWDTIKKNVFHSPLPLGVSAVDYQIAREEYSDIAKNAYGFDLLGAAVSTGLTMGMGPIGIPVSMLITSGFDYARDKRLQNYRRTMGVAALTSGVFRGDRIGLSGKSNADIKKFMEKIGAEDVLLDAKDIMQITQFASKSGLFKSLSDPTQFKEAIRNFKDMLKNLSDFTNDPNLIGIAKQVVALRNAGFSTASAGSFIKKTYIAAQFAGMSKEQAQEHMRASIMFATNNNTDPRYFAAQMNRAMLYAPALRQTGLMPEFLNNNGTLMASARELTYTADIGAMKRYGVNNELRLFYAAMKAKDQGTDVKEVLKEIESKPIDEQREIIYNYQSSSPITYQRGLTDHDIRTSVLATTKGISDIETKDQSYVDFMKRIYKDSPDKNSMTPLELVELYEQYAGVKLSRPTFALATTAADSIIKGTSDSLFGKTDRMAKRVEMRREAINARRRRDEENGLWGNVVVTYKKLYTWVAQAIGGSSQAGDRIEYAQDVQYGGGTLSDVLKRKPNTIEWSGFSIDNKLKIAASIINRGMIKTPDAEDTKKKLFEVKYFTKEELLRGWGIGESKNWHLLPKSVVDAFTSDDDIAMDEERFRQYKIKIKEASHDDIFKGDTIDTFLRLKVGEDISKKHNKTRSASIEAVNIGLRALKVGDKVALKEFRDKYRAQHRNLDSDMGLDMKRKETFTPEELQAVLPEIKSYITKHRGASSDKQYKFIKAKKDEAKMFIIDNAFRASSTESFLGRNKMSEAANLLSTEELYKLQRKFKYDQNVAANIGALIESRGVPAAELIEKVSPEVLKYGKQLYAEIDRYGLSVADTEELFKAFKLRTPEERKGMVLSKLRKLVSEERISPEAYMSLLKPAIKLALTKGKDGETSDVDEISLSLRSARSARRDFSKRAFKAFKDKYGLNKEEVAHIFDIVSQTGKTTKERNKELNEYINSIQITQGDINEIKMLREADIPIEEKRKKVDEIIRGTHVDPSGYSRLMHLLNKKLTKDDTAAYKEIDEILSKQRHLPGITIRDIGRTLDDSRLFGSKDLTAKEIYQTSHGDSVKILSKISESMQHVSKTMPKGINNLVDAIKGDSYRKVPEQ
jgi:hypothetical protein